MSEPFVVELDPKKHLLRLACGQCGDTKDLEFEIVEGQIRISFLDSMDLTTTDDGPEVYMTPVHVTV